MAGADRSTQSKSMAANLKSRGTERTQCRCPICHKVVSLLSLTTHLYACGGGRKRAEEEAGR